MALALPSVAAGVGAQEESGFGPQVHTDVEVETGARSAIVRWRLDTAEPERWYSSITYWAKGSTELREVEAGQATADRWVRLEGLQPETEYEFSLHSDSPGSESMSIDHGFTTTADGRRSPSSPVAFLLLAFALAAAGRRVP